MFIRLDAETWERCRQNLVLTLGQLPQDVLEEAANDDSFIANLDRVYEEMQDYLNARTWFRDEYGEDQDAKIAYFSMEFGLDVGLPIYSGGLGILAGDHLKSSSDLGIPLVGVGLMYQRGYFQQYLNSDGWQMERYPVNDWYNMPVTLQRDADGEPITIKVDVAGEELSTHIWKVIVGRISLYLLDANIAQNPQHLRQVTAQLYGGDRDNRIRQEILLGVGGVRALEAVNINPTVYHMNEGHSAFLALERLRLLIKDHGLSFEEAREVVFASTVFTTHTPVPAGNEVFSLERIKNYFAQIAKDLGLTWEQFLSLGQEPGMESSFSMTVLAFNLSAHCNGVSKLHGTVSRGMWQSLWKGLPNKEIPIRHITNGIHSRTWISHDMDELIARYIGPQFVDEPHEHKLWERVERIPDLELWRIHQIRKERLIFFARKRLRQQLERRGASLAEITTAGEVLTSEALTIGFARRFATYKRANLILKDVDRLMKILTNADCPVQFIFAGKAHPNDDAGKDYIRKLVHFASDPSVRMRMVFIEDYDINVARYMVQGVDVWLSTPRRPQEASGTSGMKAAANGAVNVSTLDGWWVEGYNPFVGWAIGSGEISTNTEELDRIEAEALFNLLEHEIIPVFFDLDRTEIPRRWIRMMKESMKQLGQYFNTHRMVLEYFNKMYAPAHRAAQNLNGEKYARGKELAVWRGRITSKWQNITIKSVDPSGDVNGFIMDEKKAGDELPVRVKVGLSGLKPDEIAVEVMHGALDADGEIIDGEVVRLKYESESDGAAIYSASIPCETAGRHGYAARVRPDHPDLVHPLTPFLMTWE